MSQITINAKHGQPGTTELKWQIKLFHIISLIKNIADIPELSLKQRAWCKAYRSLLYSASDGNWSPKDIPTAARVAKGLGISKQASAKMAKRIVKILLPHLEDLLHQQRIDKLSEEWALRAKEEVDRLPEYIEIKRYRGDGKKIMHWTADSAYDERINLTLQNIWNGKEISEDTMQKLKHLPVKYADVYPPSLLNLWWDKKITEYAASKSVSYEAAATKLWYRYWYKWPKDFEYLQRVCKFCGNLLPIGEKIEGRKVTIRRKYCSNKCKTYFKRYKK